MNVAATAPDLLFGEFGALRDAVGESGRVHLDRWLPFLMIYRGEIDAPSLARRVAINGPAYLVWEPKDDRVAHRILERLVEAIAERVVAPPLIFILSDQPVPLVSGKGPTLPRFMAEIGASDDPGARRAVAKLEKAVTAIRADLRQCDVERVAADDDRLVAVPSITLRLPSIHLRPDGDVYPQLEHEISVAFGDALLQSAFAYIDDGKRAPPAHYRALGRQAFLAAAKSADRKLGAVSRSFDFLLSVSPINTSEAMERFVAAKAKELPHFRYRPLAIDPDAA